MNEKARDEIGTLERWTVGVSEGGKEGL